MFRRFRNGNRRCRHLVCIENTIIEILPRIRGVCLGTEFLRNATHNKIRLTLVKKNEEIRCQATVNLKTQNSRNDIIVIERKKTRGFVFDPTTRKNGWFIYFVYHRTWYYGTGSIIRRRKTFSLELEEQNRFSSQAFVLRVMILLISPYLLHECICICLFIFNLICIYFIFICLLHS